jgi:hypothetical protein
MTALIERLDFAGNLTTSSAQRLGHDLSIISADLSEAFDQIDMLRDDLASWITAGSNSRADARASAVEVASDLAVMLRNIAAKLAPAA